MPQLGQGDKKKIIFTLISHYNNDYCFDYNAGCADGSQPVNCLVDPCQVSSCPAVNGATCVADYCGGCNAQWLLNGLDVTSQCQGTVTKLSSQ